MKFEKIKEKLDKNFSYLLTDKPLLTHEVLRHIAIIVNSVSYEFGIDHENILDFLLKPYPSNLLDFSFPFKPYIESENEVISRVIKDICSFPLWKGVGYGEIYFRLKSGKSEKDGYQIKNGKSIVSLKPRATSEGANGEELLEKYFNGNIPGSKKSHLETIRIAQTKDVTPFFEELYGYFDSYVFAELLKSAVDAQTFKQYLGVRIHQEDAKLDNNVGYIFILEDGFCFIQSKDISIELCTDFGLKYSLHFERGRDTQAVADGYATAKIGEFSKKTQKDLEALYSKNKSSFIDFVPTDLSSENYHVLLTK